MKLEQKNWEDRKNDFCPLDLGLFQALERERVLEVLQRDKALRTIDADRVRSAKRTGLAVKAIVTIVTVIKSTENVK